MSTWLLLKIGYQMGNAKRIIVRVSNISLIKHVLMYCIYSECTMQYCSQITSLFHI